MNSLILTLVMLWVCDAVPTALAKHGKGRIENMASLTISVNGGTQLQNKTTSGTSTAHGGMLKDGASLESILALLPPPSSDSQVCQELYFDNTCQPYPGKLVLLVTVNHEMIDFFLLWHASASKFLKKSCMHLRVMAEDGEAKRHLTQLSEQNSWDLDIHMDHIQMDQAPSSFLQSTLPFKSKEYNILVDRRPLYIQDLLEQRCTTFYVDVDTIWKKSPFMEIVAKDKGQRDFYAISDDMIDTNKIAEVSFCTCFMYINPTATSLNIIGQWVQSLQAHATVDQWAFNGVLNRDSKALKQKVTQLPYAKFPPGSSYSLLKDEACIAHANWMIGHENKTAFLKAVAEEMHLQWDL